MLQAGSIFKVRLLKKAGFVIDRGHLSKNYGKNFREIVIIDNNKEMYYYAVGMLFGLFKRKIVIVKELWKEYQKDSK